MARDTKGRFVKGHQTWLGKKLSKEHIEKMRITKLGNKYALGRKHTEEAKRKMRLARLGTTHTKETRKKLSLICLKEKHYHWKGGKESYCRILARRIMKKYLKRGLTKKEVVHHIDLNWKNNNIKNLRLYPSHSQHVKYHHLLKNIQKAERQMNIIKEVIENNRSF